MKNKYCHCLLLMAALVSCLVSCERDDYDKLLKETAVNKDFAANSPVASDISLLLLKNPNKWGNFLMTANLKGQVQDSYLAYEINEQKIVLRDDGKGADSMKGDGIFSVFVNMDTSDVRSMVAEQNVSVARAAALESNLKDVRNIAAFLRFNKQDSVRSQSSHAFILNDPNVSFDSRFVKFNNQMIKPVDEKSLFTAAIPIHLFPGFICPPPPSDLIPRSLMINDLHVVEDPARTWNPVSHTGAKNGAWTFNNLMSQMANSHSTPVTTTQFVLNWLQTWTAPITDNGDVASARISINTIINAWKARSLANGLPADTLDMAEAPVKLLAIVNRADLRKNAGYSSTNAGEGRFVFCVLNTASGSNTLTNSSQSFTIIFEYGINRKGCSNVQSWGHQWYALHLKDPATDATYNSDLQAITDQFVMANTNPSRPNGSSLNQIRTDEIALASPWQLREFNIDAGTHQLKLVNVKQTPADALNHSSQLADFINANCASVSATNYTMPATFNSHPLLGIKSDNTLSDPWNAAISCTGSGNVRQIISVNTCNACHGVETATFFTHVNPTSFGNAAGLSGFLTGETINDPVSGNPEAMADLDRRAKDLQALVCRSCVLFEPLTFRPLNMVH